jgi:hypothetical protein
VTKKLQTLAVVFACAIPTAGLATAQDQEKPTPPAAQKPSTPMPLHVTPLKVQVTIGRYQGEKKISSLPYTLTLNANNHANLRMGAKIPVPSGASGIQYSDIGTNIDCASTALDDGRFMLTISVDDTSIYPDDQPGAKGYASFRSFRGTNTMVLRNGETGQFTAAVDKVNGETTKVDVTLTVAK